MLWSGCGDCEAVEFVTEVTELILGFFAQKQGQTSNSIRRASGRGLTLNSIRRSVGLLPLVIGPVPQVNDLVPTNFAAAGGEGFGRL